MPSENKIIAIIPARGGSKGIPQKNIRTLAGKPLIAWTIETAKGAACLDRVVVSTDDSEIAEVADQFGAEIIWRPAKISGDTSPSEAAISHSLQHLDETEGYRPDIIVFLQCTSPLTVADDIENAVQTLLTEKADSVLTVTPFHYFLWDRDQDNNAIGINHNKTVRKMRQERGEQFLETGAIYVMRTEGFIQAKHRFYGKTALCVMPRERCLEIDEPVDFQIAEVLMLDRLK